MHRFSVLLLATILPLMLQAAPPREGFRSVEPRAQSDRTTPGTIDDRVVLGPTRPLNGTRPEWFTLPEPVPLTAEYVGEAALRQQLTSSGNRPRPTALAADDFDEDGVPDLISGYTGSGGHLLTLHRGNVDAIYSHSPAARQRKAAGSFTDSGFLTPGRVLAAPVAPDFIGVGDFDADGHRDVVIASKGGRSLYLLAGDGHGGLESARRVALAGNVTTMVAGEINRRDGLADLIVGVAGDDGSAVLVFEGPRGALMDDPERVALPAAPAALALGRLDDGSPADLAVAAGAELIVLHGRDRQLFVHPERRTGVGPAVAVKIAKLESPVVSISLGDYARDEWGRPELASLTSDGIVHLHQRAGESWRAFGRRRVLNEPVTGSHLLTARVSALPLDELVILDGAGSQLHVMLGEVRQEDDGSPGELSRPLSTRLAARPAAALPMRLNRDAIHDLVLLLDGIGAPAPAVSAPAAIITVNGSVDLGYVTDGLCQLSEAIDNANSNAGMHADCAAGAGVDVIEFDVSDVELRSLPHSLVLWDFGDGIDGSSRGCVDVWTGTWPGHGLELGGSNLTVRGLAFRGFANQQVILSGSGHHIVEGNRIGIDCADATAPGSTLSGMVVWSPDNQIGGTAGAIARNIVSHNIYGISIQETTPGVNLGTRVEGNFLGTDSTGTSARGNAHGIRLTSTEDLVVGGTAPGARNLISGNTSTGIVLSDFYDAAVGNLIQGNLIGTDVTGETPLPNGSLGVHVIGGDSNTIGGTSPAARNVIAGTGSHGIHLEGGSATLAGRGGNVVAGNYVGLDVTGSSPLGIGNVGIFVVDSPGNFIGVPEAGNVVADGLFGIAIADFTGPDLANFNTIQGNIVGLDAGGSAPLGHDHSGIILQSTSFNLVGGSLPGERNVSSANQAGIVALTAASATWTATDNVVQGNYTGTDVSGTLARGNTWGIGVQDAANTLIGGTAPGAGNLVSGNGDCGVDILTWDHPGSTTGTRVEGNRIGVDASGSLPLPNAACGVDVYDASLNTIGGMLPDAGNTIWHNSGPGVKIFEFAPRPTTGNQILGNSIHGNSVLGIDLAGDGVVNPNDLQDGDGGPNRMQNHPIVTRADVGLSETVIEGTLHSSPLKTFRVELFSSPACDPSGFGQGRDPIGSTSVMTNFNSDGSFSVILPTTIAPGSPITATATNMATADTSEFSACFATAPCTFAVFGQTVRAEDRETLSWPAPEDARWVKGPLADVGSYATSGQGELVGATEMGIAADSPAVGDGLYYLLRPSDCGSWQTAPGAEPARDTLP